jgi:hypothetical protein
VVVVVLDGVVRFRPTEEVISVNIKFLLEDSPVLIVCVTGLIFILSEVARFVGVAVAEEWVGVLKPFGRGPERQGLNHWHLWSFLLLEEAKKRLLGLGKAGKTDNDKCGYLS